jgi:2'-deoxymugineic-acid 2'-dioxygenase/mugineic-acid 3-dioxygenase
MEIVTNGALASVEHRAITNSAVARMSVATLIMPKSECHIGPAPEMVDEATNPAKFREFVFSEFMEAYDTTAASREDVLKCFRIHKN